MLLLSYHLSSLQPEELPNLISYGRILIVFTVPHLFARVLGCFKGRRNGEKEDSEKQ